MDLIILIKGTTPCIRLLSDQRRARDKKEISSRFQSSWVCRIFWKIAPGPRAELSVPSESGGETPELPGRSHSTPRRVLFKLGFPRGLMGICFD